MLNEKEICSAFTNQGYITQPYNGYFYVKDDGPVHYNINLVEYHGDIHTAIVSIHLIEMHFSMSIEFTEQETDASAIAAIERGILELKNKLQDAIDWIVENHSVITSELELNRD